jgi:cyclase
MLRPRIIPVLLLHDGGLYKTVGFKDPKYIGDPINAVRIFNEKEVDELMIVDIDASIRGQEPDYQLISRLAAECRMPLSYGGGVKRVEQFERIVALGVEKVAVSSAAVESPDLIRDAAARVGSQSVVVVLDVKRTGLLRRPEIVTYNGTRRTGRDAVDFARLVTTLGAGEIVINSVDRDGSMNGYDVDLVERVRAAVTVPITALGGAGNHEHIVDLVRRFEIVGAAAGSVFVFKGKYRAVLISYPDRIEKQQILDRARSAPQA